MSWKEFFFRWWKWGALLKLVVIMIGLGIAGVTRATAPPQVQIVNDSGLKITALSMECPSTHQCDHDDLLGGGGLDDGGSKLLVLEDAKKLGCDRVFQARLADGATLDETIDVCLDDLHHIRFAKPYAPAL